MKRALLLALAVTLLAGCGDDSSSNTTTTSAGTSTVKVYFLRDGKVWPVRRDVQPSPDLLNAAFEALRRGPTQAEQDIGLTSDVPENGSDDLTDAARAQLAHTMTQFPHHVAEIDGKLYTRADFEDQTPLILVESPLPFQDVTTPLRVTGTANTFEATFQYELVNSAGKVVDTNFVTATSGTGTRGTFDFTTKKVDDIAALRVFELSAENGSRIHEAEIPLRMSQ